MKSKIKKISYILGYPSGLTYYEFYRNKRLRMYKSFLNPMKIYKLHDKAGIIDIVHVGTITIITLYFAPRSNHILDIADFYAKKYYLDFAKWCLVSIVFNIMLLLTLMGK